MLQGLNTFLSLFIDSFKYFGRGKAWLLLFMIFVVEGFILQAHYNFYSPIFYWIIAPWINLDQQAATGFTHYPGHLMLLPYYFGWAKLIIGAIFEGAVLGGVALIFYNFSSNITSKVKLTFGGMVSRWFQLSLAWLMINGLFLLANKYLPLIFESLILQHPRRETYFYNLFLPLVFIILMAFFYFVIPYIAIYRVNLLKAIQQSFKLFFSNPFICFFTVVMVLIVPIIFSLILSNQTTLVTKFNPEIIYYILLTGIGVDILVNFFWMGTAVRFIINKE